MRKIPAALAAGALLLGLPGAPASGAPPPSCGVGTPNESFTGSFGTELQGAYVLVPFEVPAGQTRVRVRLCHDQSDASALPLPSQVAGAFRHTLDLGLYQPPGADGTYGREEFRGWGGSSRRDVLVTPEQATAGFLPGEIPAGAWAAEIGVAAVVGQADGDLDGKVDWRVEVFYASDPADTDGPWEPAPYTSAPANPDAGWYKGDLHVHSTHSGSFPMGTVLDYAFGARPAGAGLDFITLSDYVTTRHWGEIGSFQSAYPGKLIVRSAEVITYRGHVNNHASLDWADYRTGPIYERQADGSLVLERAPVAPGAAGGILDQIAASGTGWSQVNHPTTFPSKVPGFDRMCRGCSWEYSDAGTDWSKVDAFEVQTGPAGTPQQIGGDGRLGPNPFTPLAIEWWDRLRRAGHDITAVGVSDSHRAGAQDLLFSPIGEATTVVYAPELSEQGIRTAILDGHAYVKLFAADGPDLRLTARPASLYGGPEVMMGDELAALAAQFTAKVLAPAATYPSYPEPYTLHVYYQGAPLLAAPVAFDSAGEFTLEFVGAAPGDYRLQLQRGSAIEALTNPITLTLP